MLTFQDMIAALTRYWAKQGCMVHQGYDLEVGAGTFNPATFLRCLGPEPYSAVYVEPCRRPVDGRYGQNPNRMQYYYQMQVILKPSPINIVDLFLKSLESVGLKLTEHDMRLVHDDWENPTIGASGLGWKSGPMVWRLHNSPTFKRSADFLLNLSAGRLPMGLSAWQCTCRM